MSKALLVIMLGNGPLGTRLASVLDAEIAELEHRRFPDGGDLYSVSDRPGGPRCRRPAHPRPAGRQDAGPAVRRADDARAGGPLGRSRVPIPHTPVLVDDIVSTASTMIATLRHLAAAGARPAVCIAVHGIFAGDADGDLKRAGATRVVTCNTIPHESNAIDVTDAMAEALSQVVPGPWG